MHPRILSSLAILLALLAGTAARAADGEGARPRSDAAGEEIPEAVPLAPLVIDGELLFKVRGVSSYPAAERAAEIAARIEAVARDPRIATPAIVIEERPVGSAIVAGGQLLMTVHDADARIESVSRPVLATVYQRQIVLAVERWRSDRAAGKQGRNVGYAAAALLLLAAALYGLRRLRLATDAWLERRYRARLRNLQIAEFNLLHAEHIWGGVRRLVGTVFVLLALACTFGAVQFALMRFPGTRGAAASLLGLVADPLASMGRGLLAALPGLVFLLLLALVTRYVLKTLRLLFDAVEHGSVQLKGFDAEWSMPTYRIVRMLVIAFAVVIGFPYIPGSSSDAFKGVSLFLGVMFSLGSTSIIANIVAGYSMTYRRAFRVGDRIQVGEIVGIVTEARLQVTHVRSPKNEEIVIPNSVILNSAVTNFSTLAKSRGLILHTTVGIGYETPWRQVEAMLLMAAGRTERVLPQPPPFVLQRSLGDFAINYELNAHCDRPTEVLEIYAELHRNILDVFNEYGVVIMTPAYMADPAQPKMVDKAQWYAAPAQR